MKRNLLVILAAGIGMAVLPTAEAAERMAVDTVGLAGAVERLCVERCPVDAVAITRLS